MRNLFKKIMALTYITFILSIFLIPFNFSFAQTLAPCPVSSSTFTGGGGRSGGGGATGSFTYPPGTVLTPNSNCVTPYVLLAPLPGVNGGNPMTTFDTQDYNALGTYLNLVIRIIIGLAAVLAVVMIVIGGIEYMTSELPGNKEAGKEKILDALLGLLIALGAFALLNTINPNLLSTNVNITPGNVQVDFQTDLDATVPSATAYSGALPSTAPGCASGVTRSATTGIVACSTISANIDQMVAVAKQAGFSIYAGGFRTSAQQIALRVQNCNGNTTDASAACTPPTALPGHSEHESGLAFDVACNGTTITVKSDPCYMWLQANASTYGLKNLSAAYGNEPWHWSTDGH